jgi:hypothetical protein
VKFEVDVRELVNLQAKLASLPGELKDRAVAAALNRTAEKARTEIDRAVRDEYVISSDRVRSSIALRQASAARGTLTAEVQIFGSPSKRGRSMNVIAFMERKVSLAEARRRGKRNELFVQSKGRLLPILRFVFKRGSGAKVIEGAFVGNKGRTIFRRVGKARLPIEPIRVIDVGQMFRSKKVSRRVLDRINRDLPVEVDRAVKSVIARFGR